MNRLFFVNCFFEEELISSEKTLLELLCQHRVFLQLHYLSCILSEENEVPLLALRPEEGYLGFSKKWAFLDDTFSKRQEVVSWGPSLALAKWAKEKGHIYKIPDWEIVKKVNGKDFSFTLAPKLIGAEIVSKEEEIIAWHESIKGPKVLKTLYGSSGRGHCVLYKESDLSAALNFFKKEKERSNYFIAEPWVERVVDFSSQWVISEEGNFTYLGSTICENSPRGIYRRSFIGPEELLFKKYAEFFQEHLLWAKKALQKMREIGFFGSVGFDAMIYKQQEKLFLQPIVEINARKTMGWAALQLYRKLGWDNLAAFHYDLKKKEKGLLPLDALSIQGKKIPLPGQIVITAIDLKNADIL